jgi:hypothetical protein
MFTAPLTENGLFPTKLSNSGIERSAVDTVTFATNCSMTFENFHSESLLSTTENGQRFRLKVLSPSRFREALNIEQKFKG